LDSALFSGVFDLPWWGYVLGALALTHVTIASVGLVWRAPAMGLLLLLPIDLASAAS
jgi:hypothetical protein